MLFSPARSRQRRPRCALAAQRAKNLKMLALGLILTNLSEVFSHRSSVTSSFSRQAHNGAQMTVCHTQERPDAYHSVHTPGGPHIRRPAPRHTSRSAAARTCDDIRRAHTPHRHTTPAPPLLHTRARPRVRAPHDAGEVVVVGRLERCLARMRRTHARLASSC